jgi:hypothetical protein
LPSLAALSNRPPSRFAWSEKWWGIYFASVVVEKYCWNNGKADADVSEKVNLG